MRFLSMIVFVIGAYAAYVGGMTLWHSLRLDVGDTHYIYSVRFLGLTMSLQTARVVEGAVFLVGLVVVAVAVFLFIRSRSERG